MMAVSDSGPKGRKMVTTKDEILSLLKESRAEFESRFKVRKLALFGSYSRGDQSAESDVNGNWTPYFSTEEDNYQVSAGEEGGESYVFPLPAGTESVSYKLTANPTEPSYAENWMLMK